MIITNSLYAGIDHHSFIHLMETIEESLERMKSIQGNVRGEVLRTHAAYIRYREGEEGVRKVEERLSSLGYPVKLEDARNDQWYPEFQSVLTILIAREIFNWTEEDILHMGESAPKQSFIIKMFIKYFVSVQEVFDRASQYWEKHFDFGALEKGELNEEEGYIKVRIKGYRFHPLICGPYFIGYLQSVARLSMKAKEVRAEKMACTFQGDSYDEYRISWE